MELGVFTNMPMLSFGELKKEFLFYSKMGINLICFPFDYPTGPHNVSEEWIRRLENLVKKLGIKTAIHAPFVSTNLLSLCNEHRKISIEEIKMSVDLAKRLGSHSVVFHIGYTNVYSRRNDLYKKIMTSSLNDIFRYAKKSGVSIAAENLPFRHDRANYPYSEKEFLELVKMNNDIKFCIDTGHLHRSKINVYKFIKKFIGRTICIHLHDATKEEDHLVIGKGDLDFEKIFSILERFNYKEVVLLETLTKENTIKSYNRLIRMGVVK